MTKKKIKVNEVLPDLSFMLDLLTEAEQDLLISHMSVQVYRKNEVLYEEGDIPTYMHCLIAGKVKVSKEGIGGRTQIIRMVRPVEFFGYRAGFSGQLYVNSASAFEQSVVVKIPVNTMVRLLKGNAQLGWFFIERLARNLGYADERMVSLTQKHIRGRLAESLLFLKQNYGLEEDGSTLSIYLSREDLASHSNMTTSNAIRTLSAFAQERIIAIDGRKIKIIDERRLEAISGGGK
ncbi:MAG: Crp/Fnr family transcriptional regulator [Bacteroidaceae bacterium]|nr:Crp/Fnr family transcriptional regulator [Bacteroidaceae bacterium]